jgi:hypothetical protein
MSVATKVHQDQLTGTTTIERVQDCTPVVNYAEQQRIAGATGSSEMRHAARFPAVIVEQYINNRGITFNEFLSNPVHVKTMLQDSALSAFRIWEGKV